MERLITFHFLNKARFILCFVLLFLLCWENCFAQQSLVRDSLKRELKTAKEDTNKVDLLYAISRSYILDDASKQLPYIDEMLELSKRLNYHQGIGRAYLSYADHYLRSNVPDKALSYLMKAESLCNKGLYDKGIPVVNNLLGIYYKNKGAYEQSLMNYQQALSYYEKVENKRHQSITLSVISNLFFTMKRYKESKNYRLKAINIYKEINDTEGESIELSNLGLLYITTEEYEKVGCEIVPSMSFCEAPKDAYIIGLKELPIENQFPLVKDKLEHKHIYFAHCYKKQKNWKTVLNRFVPNGKILDLEFLKYDDGKRVAAFGQSAGVKIY